MRLIFSVFIQKETHLKFISVQPIQETIIGMAKKDKQVLKTQHGTLITESHELHLNIWVIFGAPEG